MNIEEVRKIWSALLGIDSVADGGDFFELGGDSLAAMNLICSVKAESGKLVSLGLLFENPKLGDFVAALNGHSPEPRVESSLFITVNECPGSIPVFCFGHAPFLGAERSVYFHPGIYEQIHNNARSLSKQDILRLIEEFVEEVRSLHPTDGPYRLSGYCHGGWLAMCIAQALTKRGKIVDYLGFIEMFPRPEWRSPWLFRALRPATSTTTVKTGFFHCLSRLSRLGFIGQCIERLNPSGSLQRRITHFESVQAYRNFEANIFGQSVNTHVHLFVQNGLVEDDQFPSVVRHWKMGARAGLEIHPIIDGDHHSIRQPHNRTAICNRMVNILNLVSSTADRTAAPNRPHSIEKDIAGGNLLSRAILQNSGLRFYDQSSGETKDAADIVSGYADTRQPEKRLAFVYQDNSLDSVAAIFGILDAGFAVALLSTQLDNARKQSLERLYRPFLIRDPGRQKISEYRVWQCHGRESVFQRVDKSGDPPIDQNVDLLLTTSGTTGSPKFVKLSIENLLANARSIAEYLPVCSEDICPLNLPLDYSYGLSILTSNSLCGGTIVCSVRNVTDPQFWVDFRQLEMTTLAGTPDFYHLLGSLGFLDWSLPSLRYLTQAGGALDVASIRKFASYARQQNVQFFVMYGQTEATARMSYLPSEMVESHAGSIGVAIPGGKLEVDNETNELIYQGPNVFGGYAESLSDLGVYQKHDQLRTGDLAVKEADGVFRITGRLKRIVKILGARVNLDELESLLTHSFPGTRFACVRLENERVRVVQQGTHWTPDEVLAKMRSILRIPPDIVEVVTIDTMPISPNGKVDYSTIAALGMRQG